MLAVALYSYSHQQVIATQGDRYVMEVICEWQWTDTASHSGPSWQVWCANYLLVQH